MNPKRATVVGMFVATAIAAAGLIWLVNRQPAAPQAGTLTIRHAAVRDVSPPLATIAPSASESPPTTETPTREEDDDDEADADLPKNVVAPQGAAGESTPAATATVTIPPESVAIEQKEPGDETIAGDRRQLRRFGRRL